MELNLHGSYKVGAKVKTPDGVFEILEVISAEDRYELDGVTYREYPDEEPDLEWVETLARVRQLPQEEVDQIAEAAATAAAKAKQERQLKSDLIAKQAGDREAQFQLFLAGEFSENIWSGYDLPFVLYQAGNMAASPIRTNPDCYQPQHVGNGLGYDCKTTADLEALFQFIYDVSDPKPSIEKAENKARYCDTIGYKGYLAGADYYRWVLARGYAK